ncbi:glycine cleavage system aminomethyltransferase GcvT [Hwanghaeella sp.]|uniref:glycine cleavage system aminomethyltransferase GcvT n=1 Tax=Hwanghaeella sp. TaxID=2605943 RepID=UPI003CCB8157
MSAETEDQATDLKKTPLHALHQRLGAKMAGFAGYDMPIQYGLGILKEHLHTRAAAGLFDVSHMGQAWLTGDDPAAAMEGMVPGDLQGLAPGQQRYTQFLNDQGGILDDLMVTRAGEPMGHDGLFVVVNAACKDADFARMEKTLAGAAVLERIENRALIALQGPQAADVLSRFADGVATMPFMTAKRISVAGVDCLVSRSGYSGEDGYEISIPEADALGLSETLLGCEEVEAIGLGARDSLRLEAGLCLYGHDIDEGTTPIEAGLLWSIGTRRRTEGGFPGAAIVQAQIKDGVARKRVGILPEGRAPAREGTEILSADGEPIGAVTSGGFGPSVGGPVAMGYVATDHAAAGTPVQLSVRGKLLPASVRKLPFVEQRYYRG